jgi:mannose-6-phosphate isomerase-like protein (cupin superfamily)
MTSFDVESLLRDLGQTGKRYLEFLRSESLSAGFYVLPPGAEDTQTPHHEDEVYYVVRGRARFEVDGRSQAVRGGSILFVPAEAKHSFQGIEEELVTLVLFAPPESEG